jgi:hypothetical protein
MRTRGPQHNVRENLEVGAHSKRDVVVIATREKLIAVS